MSPAPISVLCSLSVYHSYGETTHIGPRFTDKAIQLSEILTAANADDPLKDLARSVSHRGVVFFVDQDINIEQQKKLGSPIAELSGKPKFVQIADIPYQKGDWCWEIGAEIWERYRSSIPTLNHGEKSSELCRKTEAFRKSKRKTYIHEEISIVNGGETFEEFLECGRESVIVAVTIRIGIACWAQEDWRLTWPTKGKRWGSAKMTSKWTSTRVSPPLAILGEVNCWRRGLRNNEHTWRKYPYR